MNEPIRSRLILKYTNAANIIATPPLSNGDTEDPDLVPMQQLLQRQARYLARAQSALSPELDIVNQKLLLKRLNDITSIANSKFYSYRYDLVPEAWKQLYTDTLILTSFHQLSQAEELDDETVTLLVETLDRALITTGGQGRSLGPKWIEETLDLLDICWREVSTNERPNKRQKADDPAAQFSTVEPYGRPFLSHDKQCPRHRGWSVEKFEDYMKSTGYPKPVIFTDLITAWPALTTRPWKSTSYLLSKTLNGKRLVPVEVGRSYVDEGWGQEVIPFKSFLSKYVNTESTQVGYLAQHNLLRQIPSLRNDIQIPDFCWADVPNHPSDPTKDQAKVDMPQLNAWFGPAKTITPLHTDGYHNLLCQVVGSKYVRLYPPSATKAMRPRCPEHGVDMSNTSEIDVGVVEGWDAMPEKMDNNELEWMKRGLKGWEYRECVLEPGDTLLIPMGWWHYVRSLSISFSVSFWWN